MEFWGIEVKPGESVKCIPGYQKYLHLSSASLAELKKEKSSDALLSVKIDNKKLVIGILSADKAPQLSFDLVFEKEFELSHTGKTSVHLCGYKAIMDEDRPELSGSEEESEDEMGLPVNAGKEEAKALQPNPLAKAIAAKPALPAAMQKAQAGKHEKPVEDEDDDSDDSDEDDSEKDASDEDMMDGGNESDSEEDDDLEEASSEEDGRTPKKVGTGLKRPAEIAVKTTAEKKAKLVTPTSQKTGVDVKKGVVHIATPHPNKQVGKTPAANDKSKQQTPKSLGQFSCKSCSKGFNSDSALQSHTKAKHSGK